MSWIICMIVEKYKGESLSLFRLFLEKIKRLESLEIILDIFFNDKKFIIIL